MNGKEHPNVGESGFVVNWDTRRLWAQWALDQLECAKALQSSPLAWLNHARDAERAGEEVVVSNYIIN